MTRVPPPRFDPAVEAWIKERLLGEGDVPLDPNWREVVLGGTPAEVMARNADNTRHITVTMSSAFAVLLSGAAEGAGMARTAYIRHILAAHLSRIHDIDPDELYEIGCPHPRMAING